MLALKFALCQSTQPVKSSRTFQVLSSGSVFSKILGRQETGDLHADADSHANQLLLPLLLPHLQSLGVGHSTTPNSYASCLVFFNLRTSRGNENIGLKSVMTFHTARRKSTPRETARLGETRFNPVTLVKRLILVENPKVFFMRKDCFPERKAEQRK